MNWYLLAAGFVVLGTACLPWKWLQRLVLSSLSTGLRLTLAGGIGVTGFWALWPDLAPTGTDPQTVLSRLGGSPLVDKLPSAWLWWLVAASGLLLFLPVVTLLDLSRTLAPYLGHGRVSWRGWWEKHHTGEADRRNARPPLFDFLVAQNAAPAPSSRKRLADLVDE